MEITHGKKFEKPQPGNYTGTVIDIVLLPNQASTFNGATTYQNKIRVVWTIGPAYPGQVAVTKEGKPFEVIGTYNAKLIDKPKKSKLYELLEQMLQGAPPLVKNDEELEALMLNRSNQLFLVANANPSDPTDPFINIAGVTPLAPGQVAPPVPAGFIRKKFRPVTQAGPNGQPVQTYAQPPATTQVNQAVSAQSKNVSFEKPANPTF
jgi:hypothetical protein